MRRLLTITLLLIAHTAASAAEVRVFAAVSLTEALEEIAAGYTRDDIVFHFGASSLLARQIELGAPADLFLSADEARMNALAAKRLIVPSTRISVLSNTLVVVGVPLARAKLIALAEPSSVPAGVYARTWLQTIGMWERLAP